MNLVNQALVSIVLLSCSLHAGEPFVIPKMDHELSDFLSDFSRSLFQKHVDPKDIDPSPFIITVKPTIEEQFEQLDFSPLSYEQSEINYLKEMLIKCIKSPGKKVLYLVDHPSNIETTLKLFTRFKQHALFNDVCSNIAGEPWTFELLINDSEIPTNTCTVINLICCKKKPLAGDELV